MRDNGMRNVREVYCMRAENVDFDAGTIFTPDSKTVSGVGSSPWAAAWSKYSRRAVRGRAKAGCGCPATRESSLGPITPSQRGIYTSSSNPERPRPGVSIPVIGLLRRRPELPAFRRGVVLPVGGDRLRTPCGNLKRSTHGIALLRTHRCRLR